MLSSLVHSSNERWENARNRLENQELQQAQLGGESHSVRFGSKSWVGLISSVLDTAFTCLFCHHDKSVTVRLDRKEGIAQLVCRVCDQRFQAKVNRVFPRARSPLFLMRP